MADFGFLFDENADWTKIGVFRFFTGDGDFRLFDGERSLAIGDRFSFSTGFTFIGAEHSETIGVQKFNIDNCFLNGFADVEKQSCFFDFFTDEDEAQFLLWVDISDNFPQINI